MIFLQDCIEEEDLIRLLQEVSGDGYSLHLQSLAEEGGKAGGKAPSRKAGREPGEEGGEGGGAVLLLCKVFAALG